MQKSEGSDLACLQPEERIEIFLQNAWHRGDRQIANKVMDLAPLISKANIYTACVCGDIDAVGSLLAAYPAQAAISGGPHNRPPILYATWSCFLNKKADEIAEIVEKLISFGADPNSFWITDSGLKESALYGCVEANCVAVAETLISAQADPNDGESLYHACEQNNLGLLDVLAKGGLKPDDISYCIKHAMDYRWDEGIRWFLAQGADPNAVHPSASETSLHWAVKRGCSVEIISDLLKAGADPNAKTTTGQSAFLGIVGYTPLDFALRLGRSDVASVLAAHGTIESNFSDYDKFVIGVANGQEQGRLSDVEVFVEALTENDKTLVSHVAQLRNWDAVPLMVELGWPVNAVGWMGATPIYWTLCFGETHMVEYLLKHGASMKAVGGYFKNPLHTVIHCQWGKDGDWEGSLECLLQHEIAIPDGIYPCGHDDYDVILAHHLGLAGRSL